MDEAVRLTRPRISEEQAKLLRAPFAPGQIGKLPRKGTPGLDYVGHAAVTDRLLAVDPEWSWEPVAFDADGAPLIQRDDKEAKLWIRLTVCGVTRLGVGICSLSAFELEKQLISDALRNASMRFGVALDLWTKQDLHDAAEPPPARPVPASKERIDALVDRVDRLAPDTREEFTEWKNGHDFGWPWTPAACDAIEKKIAELILTAFPEGEEPF